ncbi:cytochrome P450 [Nonomuraea sp. NPDC026600]|uniref:cytochrome P450 n=1 Tax=Nonomuraea sp. NPDC026600 TaxID=3155363 RepID=UPI0033C76DFC
MDCTTCPPSEETVRCPFAYFKELRETAPVHRYADAGDGEPPMFVVTSWKEATSVLLRPEIFVNNLSGVLPAFDNNQEPSPAPEVPTFHEAYNVFFSDGADHKIKRSWVLKLVTREKLESFRPIIEAEVDRLIDAFIADGHCDIRAQLTDRMPTHLVRQIMGLPDAADAMVKRLSRALTENDNNPAQTDEQIEELRQSWVDLLNLNVELLRAREANPIEGDYVSELVQYQKAQDGALDVNALAKHLAVTIFGADHAMGGHLADIAARLGRDPELQERVRKDRSLIRSLANESLRFDSPLPWLFRQCVENTTIGEVDVPAGSLVLVASVAANHDPAEFSSPEVFDIDRPNIERNHLTLGRGVHRCAGADMAKLQADVTVNKLLDRLEDIRLDDAHSDLLPELSFGFRVPTAVHLTFRAVS